MNKLFNIQHKASGIVYPVYALDKWHAISKAVAIHGQNSSNIDFKSIK